MTEVLYLNLVTLIYVVTSVVLRSLRLVSGTRASGQMTRKAFRTLTVASMLSLMLMKCRVASRTRLLMTITGSSVVTDGVNFVPSALATCASKLVIPMD